MSDEVAYCIGTFIILFIIYLAGACLNSNHSDSASAKHIISGANDFEFPAPFSEDNWEFKESNNENETLCIDDHGNSIVVHKLNSSEFDGLNDSYIHV